jgi:hypothetical protein
MLMYIYTKVFINGRKKAKIGGGGGKSKSTATKRGIYIPCTVEISMPK